MLSTETTRWTLRNADRRLTCIERSTPTGSDCAILYNGLPVATRALPAEDVYAWAEETRLAWESAGWLKAGADDQSALG
jgi:hypothetical protein